MCGFERREVEVRLVQIMNGFVSHGDDTYIIVGTVGNILIF